MLHILAIISIVTLLIAVTMVSITIKEYWSESVAIGVGTIGTICLAVSMLAVITNW